MIVYRWSELINIRSSAFIMTGSVYLILLFCIVDAHTKPDFRFYMEKFVLQNFDSEVIEILKSRLVQLNNRSFVSGELLLRRSISQCQVKATVNLIRSNRQKQPLLNVRFEVCSFLEKTDNSYLFKIFLKTLQRNASVNIKCPLQPVS